MNAAQGPPGLGPARYLAHDPMQPMLAPVGSNMGRPLVKPNREWYDPALPRSAVHGG